MSRSRLVIRVALSLVFTTSLLAQGHDLRVTLDAPEAPQPGQTYTVRGTIENAGSVPALDVFVSLDVVYYRSCYEHFPLGNLRAGQKKTVECTVTLPATDLPSYTFAPSILAFTQSDAVDANYDDNALHLRIPIATPPDLFAIVFPASAKPALPFRLEVRYGNYAHTAATGTTITITAPTRFVNVPDFCTVTGNRAVCDVGTVPAIDISGQTGTSLFPVEIEAPDISDHRFEVPITIDANEPDAGPASDATRAQVSTLRTFFVTNTDDAGSGSLRAALQAANSIDLPSRSLIAFRIPPGAQAWQTIRVASPLPPVVARSIWIDGSTQAEYFGDTNPAGPEIEITGIALADGNGFDAGGACEITISGLAINGFPRNGIFAGPKRCEGFPKRIEGNYIGVDPTGNVAIPNARGIVIEPRASDLTQWFIERNVVSGNTRAGIYLVHGRHLVQQNRIGVNAAQTAPLGNGASGIYIGPGAGGTDVNNNYIGFNHHFGVALDRSTAYVAMHGNSFHANWQRGIDWGLDGGASEGPVPMPEITSVRFENGKTIIEGTHRANSTFAPFINLYWNDAPDDSGFGEGQYFLAEIRAPYEPLGTFSYTHEGDLRGKWITATATRVNYVGWLTTPPVQSQTNEQGFLITTSEFSRAVEVR